MEKKRNMAMDLIRSFALFCVVCVHFFFAGFYSNVVEGEKMYIMTLLRTFFMICVPLFIILSGYLVCKKTLSFKYYKGIIRVLVLYFLAILVCYLYNCYVAGTEFVFKDFLLETLSFSAPLYSWYVEMYIGLFLIIPFLNLAYNGLKSQAQKTVLILTLAFLNVIPTVLNVKGQIIPDYWLDTYPITYYFIGCYLREFPKVLPKKVWALCLVVANILMGTYSYHYFFGKNYLFSDWNGFNSVAAMIMSTAVFAILMDVGFKKENFFTKGISKVLFYISKLSFGAYLLSYIFDQIFHALLADKVEVIGDRFIYMPLVVLAVFVCSILLSAVIDGVYTILCKLCGYIYSLFPKKREA
ncbi:MAG: acyltransferase family protein [Clostridia bacterium]|nr:acyltransferase family protein [Clostridia bacterium]